MTPLGFFNRVLFQWLFVRLARVIDDETAKQIGWTWIIGVWPLSGWGSPYRYVRERRK